MLRNKLAVTISVILACILVINAAGTSVFAAGPAHEDPEVAKLVYNNLALLRYYTESLNYVLSKNTEEINIRFGTMPFANVPENLKNSTDVFSSASINITGYIVAIDQDLTEQRLLLGQKRYDKALEVTARAQVNLAEAYRELGNLDLSANTTGELLKIDSLPPESQLRIAYNEVLAQIQRIKEMLDLYLKLLLASAGNFQLAGVTLPEETIPVLSQQLENSTQEIENIAQQKIGQAHLAEINELISLGKAILKNIQETNSQNNVLLPTEITLTINPNIAFVGDKIRFSGSLTSEGIPFPGQTVQIILNGAPFASAATGADGGFSGNLQVPYIYINETELQAIYYPGEKEASLYIVSLSPIVKLTVLFYEATLVITPEQKAYPGRDTIMTGVFDYAYNPLAEERTIEIYLDGVLLAGDDVGRTFSETIKIAPETETGNHTLEISATPEKRYAPVFASASINVARVTPYLTMDIPGIAVIPGNVDIQGRLFSNISTVSGAKGEAGLDTAQSDFTSSNNGTFDTRLGVGLGFGIIGSQDLKLTITPQEPWFDTLLVTRKILVINIINCGLILGLLLLLGFYLPAKLKRKLALPAEEAAVKMTIIQPQPASEPASEPAVETVSAKSLAKEDETPVEPRKGILNWYRVAITFIQRLTQAVLKPNQTLREFAVETGGFMGPAAGYFAEFTRMVERLIYSPYVPRAEDVNTGRMLANKIDKEFGANRISQSAVSEDTLFPQHGAAATSSRDAESPIFAAASSQTNRLVMGNQLFFLMLTLAVAIIFYVLITIITLGLAR